MVSSQIIVSSQLIKFECLKIVPNSFRFLHISKTFLEDIKEYYQAKVESLDFEHATEESEKKINSWVESQTNGIVWKHDGGSTRDYGILSINMKWTKRKYG